MNCDELLAILNGYVDGEIDPKLCRDLEKHLAGCDPCKVVVDTIRKTITLFKNGDPYEIPAPFRSRLHKTLREQWKKCH